MNEELKRLYIGVLKYNKIINNCAKYPYNEDSDCFVVQFHRHPFWIFLYPQKELNE